MYRNVNDIIRTMSQIHGREISMYDPSFLEKALEKRCHDTGIPTAEAYHRYLEASAAEAELYCGSLNITYSDFFRNPLTFALLEQWVLPGLISQNTGAEIRVWSAGCSCGQEAYSIAMLLSNLGPVEGQPVRFRIFATDISESALDFARRGVYAEDAVQNLRMKEINSYFLKMGESYTIIPPLKNSVSFSTYDLLDQNSAYPPESIYGDFDIVFCSNLLFYYKPEVQQFILQKVQQATAHGGYLITGEAERAFVLQNCRLKMIAPPAAVFQNKKA